MSIISFLRDYEFKFGEIDTEDGKFVIRDEDNVVANTEQNIKIYRDAGIDEIIKSAGDFNLEYVKDGQGNFFAETVLTPIATVYYELLPEVFGPETAEILILNSQQVDECTDQVSDDAFDGGLSEDQRRTLTRCYMNRVFQAIAVAGLTRTFPAYTGPGGSIIPIFNVLPKNNPSGFQITLLSSIIPTSSSKIFTPVEFTVESPIDKANRFRLEKSGPPKKIEDVFNPKETVSDEGDGSISFNFSEKTLDGSEGALFFKGDITNFSAGSNLGEYEISVEYEQGGETVETEAKAKIGENAYIESEVGDITLYDFSGENNEFNLDPANTDSDGNVTSPAEEAVLEFYTIDDQYESVVITGSYSEDNPDAFIQELKTKIEDLESGDKALKYASFKKDGEKVKFGGRLAYASFSSPQASDQKQADPLTAFFNLPVLVYVSESEEIEDPEPTVENPDIENVREVTPVSKAPFFETDEKNKWAFITKNAAPVGSDPQSIDISASAFDPSFSIEDAPTDIVDKAMGEKRGDEPRESDYKGFGGTVKDYQNGGRKQVNEGESILEDFFKFHKQFIEDNFQVIHIGLTSSGTPIVSSPESLTVEI
jgi:hypothetical protein